MTDLSPKMSHKLSKNVTQIVKYCHTNCQILSSEAENSDPSQVLLLGFCIFALYCGPYLSSYFPPHVSDYLRSTLGVYCCPTKIAVASKRAFQRRPLLDTCVLWSGRVPLIVKFNTMNFTTWECLYLFLAVPIVSKQGRILLFENVTFW